MGSREVSIGERAAAVSIAASALDAMAAEWIEARASGSLERVMAAGPALDAAVQDYRRARGKPPPAPYDAEAELQRLRDGLAERGILTGRNPDGVEQTVDTVLLVIDEMREALRQMLVERVAGRITEDP